MSPFVPALQRRLGPRVDVSDDTVQVPLPDLLTALDVAEASGVLVLGLEGFRRVAGGLMPDLDFVADLGDDDLPVAAAADEARAIARTWQAGGGGPDVVEIVY